MQIQPKIIKDFKKALSSEGLRFTEQRLQVLEDILSSDSHRDCNEIFQSIKIKGHQVSIPTIYRTLDVLVDYGFIRKLDIGDGAVKYEKKLGHPRHDHMICIESGKIIEFIDERIEQVQDEIASNNDYEIVGRVHQLFVKPKKK
ncbi:MAG: hypothetical protein CMG59_04085 [Candidatus Marinimicrobia bacterium]|nr:hypothetical protein [Candidatus Neomarinimicrobiota bacterium]|tara:strand:+ start:3533 stop:3964 length:432 start_codon:yes stop_codon:yes gene_type:complete